MFVNLFVNLKKKLIMLKKLFVLSMAFLSMVTVTNAQRDCGTMEHLEYLKSQDPLLELRMQDIEQQVQEWMIHHADDARTLKTIPVVVHVVYNTSPENLSDAAILSQITVLNADFTRTNADASNTPAAFQGIAANSEIEFCMASVDPTGAATNGIRRVSTSVTSFSTNDAVKYTSQGGDDAWPSSSYLNIWVCDLSGGLLGYAQFPGGPAATDGVVCDYAYFGTIGSTPPFHLGRTATHEVGHWLNLYHIWGDDGTSCTGSDQVSDTPNQADENYGCPSFPAISCSNGPNGDMFMNYMDYTDDVCMNLFTTAQATRMNALFASGGLRYSLLSSNGCGTPSGCGTPTGMSTSSISGTGATFNWNAVSGATSYNIRYKLTSDQTWTTTTSSTNSKVVSGLVVCSAYEWQVQAVCSSGSGSYTTSTNFSTISCPASYCSSQGNSTVDEWISNITMGSINNTSGNNGGYANYTNLSTSVAQSASVTINMTPGFAGQVYTEYWKVWIDYNADLDFADAGENVASSTGTGLRTATFTVPANATIGNTRMRVQMKYGAYTATSCETFTYGEVEDYTVNITAGGGGSCNTNYEPNNSISTPKPISVGVNYSSYICPVGDEDWYSFSNTSNKKHIKVTLISLPADYDMQLYNPSNVLVGSSANGGTSDETIIYNNGAVGSYKIRVYGYNGAMHNTDSYVLKAATKATPYSSRLMEDVESVDGILSNVNLYPNPADAMVNIFFNSTIDMNATVIVTDILGRELFNTEHSVTAGDNLLYLDVSNYANGYYLVSIIQGDQTIVQKIVVE